MPAAMTVRDQQQTLVDEFGFIENRQERLGAVVDSARNLPRLTEAERTETHLVPGCTSRVWVVGQLDDGRCRFTCDCDSPLVRGLVALLCRCYEGVTPADARDTESTVLEELGLLRDLSPTRRNGLDAVRHRIRQLAATWS